jgi:photosystem II stability/assembly factor-like uncharacterized protein
MYHNRKDHLYYREIKMKQIKQIIIFGILIFLVSCAIPQPIQISEPTQGGSDKSGVATEQATLPSEMIAPTDAPAENPSAAQIAGQEISISKLTMVNTLEGWAWATDATNATILVRTLDGANAWMDVSPPAEYRITNSSFFGSQYAWLTVLDPKENWGILSTSDGGANWNLLPSFDAIKGASLTFLNEKVGIAELADIGAGNAYIRQYETDDGGQTWSLLPLISPDSAANLPEGTIHLCNICGDVLYTDMERAMIIKGEMANEPSGMVNIAYSSDRGFNWSHSSVSLPEEYKNGNIAPFMPKFDGSQGVLPINVTKSKDDGSLEFSMLFIYQTTDNGSTWQLQDSRLNVGAVYIETPQYASSKDIFVRCADGLCYTNDAGATFVVNPSSLHFGFNAPQTDYVSNFQFVTSQNGFAVVGAGTTPQVWVTNDFGVQWSRLQPRLLP